MVSTGVFGLTFFLGTRSRVTLRRPLTEHESMQTDSHGKEGEKDLVTVEIFSTHNSHMQQLPYSVCVHCHAVTHDGS